MWNRSRFEDLTWQEDALYQDPRGTDLPRHRAPRRHHHEPFTDRQEARRELDAAGLSPPGTLSGLARMPPSSLSLVTVIWEVSI